MNTGLRLGLGGAALLALGITLWMLADGGSTPGQLGGSTLGPSGAADAPPSAEERLVHVVGESDVVSEAPASAAAVNLSPQPQVELGANEAAELPTSSAPERTTIVRLEPREIEAPALQLRFEDPAGQPVTGGVVVLNLPQDVEDLEDGELASSSHGRRVRLATVGLDGEGGALLQDLPSMSANPSFLATLIAPGFDCDRPHQRLGALGVRWGFDVPEIPLRSAPLLPIQVTVRDPDGNVLPDFPVFALGYDEEVVHSVADQVHRHRALSALGTGRERLWSTGVTDYDGRVELPRVTGEAVWLYSADPGWRIEPLRVDPGQSVVVARVYPVGYARFELGGGPYDPFGPPAEAGQLLTWKVEVAPQTLLQGVDAILSAPEHYFLRGRGSLDYSFDAMREWWPEMHAGVLGMVRGGHSWSVVYSGSVQSFEGRTTWSVDLQNLVGLDGIWRENGPLETGVDLAEERVPLRVLYPDGTPADAELSLSFGGREHAVQVVDGEAKVELPIGAGTYRLSSGSGASLASELWAGDFEGWLRAGVNDGQSGAIPHAVVDFAARLRVEPPAGHTGAFSVALGVTLGERTVQVDSTPPSTEPIDWRRLPYGAWHIERRGSDGELLDRVDVELLRGRAVILDGAGSLQPWDGDLRH